MIDLWPPTRRRALGKQGTPPAGAQKAKRGKFYYTTGLDARRIQDFVHARDQRRRAERLRKERAAAAQVVGTKSIPRVSRHEEDARVGRTIANALSELGPAQVREDDIGDEQIYRGVRLEVQRLLGAPRRTHRKPRPSERSGYKLPHGALIIDDKDRPWSHKEAIIVTSRASVT